jgi:hypothetical protein
MVLSLLMSGCAGVTATPEPDVAESTLAASSEQVQTAVVEVLSRGGYSVEQDESGTITTGMRREIRGPWNWLLRWRFGTGKSHVAAQIIAQDSDSSRLRLQVFHFGKDGLFDRWEDADTPLPQSAANQIRLIKNKLRLL